MLESAPGRQLPRYPIESVNNVLRLVLMLRDQRQIRLTGASAALGVAPSTAHRLLAMLEHHGFARNDEALRAYVAGRTLNEIGLAVVRKLGINEFARPTMEALQQSCNETVHLASLERDRVLYIACVESSRALRVASRVGRTLPAHCTSVGKAILATLSDEQIIELYPSEQLPVETAESVGQRSVLLRELAEIRKVGYATNRGESENGVGSVAVPIPGGEIKGRLMALSIAAPLSRLDAATEAALAPEITLAAEKIAAARERTAAMKSS